MRVNTVARTLVSVTAVFGLAAGSLAGATAGFATPQQAATSAASSQDASVLAVNNLGLSTPRARNWQCRLLSNGYNPGPLDGQLGTKSWMAAQRMFNDLGLKAGAVDGIVGPRTIRALQKYLNLYGYDLAVDGIAGPHTKAAFWSLNGGC